MNQAASALAAFHLIGDRHGIETVTASEHGLRPALFARYSDLSQLRYDYPVVLLKSPVDGEWVVSLSEITNRLLREIAPPGPDGEATRRQVLAQERVMRSLLSSGQHGSLSLFREAARRQLVGEEPEAGSAEAEMDETLQRAAAALDVDGELLDCDAGLASGLLERAWRISEAEKARKLYAQIDRLAQKLSDILEVDFMYSPDARDPQRLSETVGGSDRDVFDFEVMARLLQSRPTAEPLPKTRRQRIQNAIGVLRSQRFVAPDTADADRTTTHRFLFNDCREARDAFRARLPEMAELVRAISIAELEIDNHYEPSRHDAFFAEFDESKLGPADLEPFPAYLICSLNPDAGEQAAIRDILRAGLPFRILHQADDILGFDTLAEGQLAFGVRGQQPAQMAMGLGRVFVLQAASSSLYALRDEILHGMGGNDPALFSVYAGAGYLESAAATESRALPGFVYDPSAPGGLAGRFKLAANPQPEVDWPIHELQYEDAEHGLKTEEVRFNLVDFIAGDVFFSGHFGGHFAAVPRSGWSDEMLPVAETLDMSPGERADVVPYVLLADAEGGMHRAVVDERLIDAALRCRQAWRDLQEWGGIGNSFAARALAGAREALETEKAQMLAQAATVPAPAGDGTVAEPPAPAPAAGTAPEEPVPEPVSEPSSDDPWIETIRCTTCNECTQLNDRMFAYNEDKRAYIADPDAGTYRELVEAAESCQVSIIHPGKPRNPDEPGLEELLERAEPFL